MLGNTVLVREHLVEVKVENKVKYGLDAKLDRCLIDRIGFSYRIGLKEIGP